MIAGITTGGRANLLNGRFPHQSTTIENISIRRFKIIRRIVPLTLLTKCATILDTLRLNACKRELSLYLCVLGKASKVT